MPISRKLLVIVYMLLGMFTSYLPVDIYSVGSSEVHTFLMNGDTKQPLWCLKMWLFQSIRDLLCKIQQPYTSFFLTSLFSIPPPLSFRSCLSVPVLLSHSKIILLSLSLRPCSFFCVSISLSLSLSPSLCLKCMFQIVKRLHSCQDHLYFSCLHVKIL